MASPSARALLPVLALFTLAASAVPVFADTESGSSLADPVLANAWRTLRIVDCARCHGKRYDGLAAPSIVRYAAIQDREAFVRMVFDGDPQRGMPAYRSNPYVAGIQGTPDRRHYNPLGGVHGGYFLHADARSRIVMLTPQGRQTFARALPLWRKAQDEVNASLGDQEKWRGCTTHCSGPCGACLPGGRRMGSMDFWIANVHAYAQS
jgi:hypothetical protein